MQGYSGERTPKTTCGLQPNSIRTNAKLHRTITIQSIGNVAVGPTISDLGAVAGGSLLAGQTYQIGFSPANSCGFNTYVQNRFMTGGSGSSSALRAAIPQVSGAAGYYLYMSDAGVNNFGVVGYITEAQRAAGGVQYIGPWTITTGNSNPAGTVDFYSGVGVNSGTFFQTSAIFSPDRLVPPFATGATDITTGGSLPFNTSISYYVHAYNKYGVTGYTYTTLAIRTANDSNNTHMLRIPIPTIANADGYEVFCSSNGAAGSNAGFLARVTASQLAAGGCRITGQQTVDNAGTAPAGSVDCLVGSTTATYNSGSFTSNSTALPQLVTPYDCAGFNKIYLLQKVTVTDNRFYLGSNSFTWDIYTLNKVTGEFARIANNINPLVSPSFVIDGDQIIVLLNSVGDGWNPQVQLWLECC